MYFWTYSKLCMFGLRLLPKQPHRGVRKTQDPGSLVLFSLLLTRLFPDSSSGERSTA